MTHEYRQMLIDRKTHDEISSAKAILGAISGKRVSSKEAIDELLGRRLRFIRLDRSIRAYVNAFVSDAALSRNVLGVMLFGSVARNRFGKYSDIDVLVVVRGNAVDSMGKINGMVDEAESLRKPLISSGLHLRIRPMVVSEDELGSFRPIYIDLLEDGVVLFERNDTLFNFMNDIRRSVDYEKVVVGGAAVVRWRIRG